MDFVFSPTHAIQVTAAYSKAVLVAILPQVSDFAERLELQVPMPITTNQVAHFAQVPILEMMPGGHLRLNSGNMFWYHYGHVTGFESPWSFFGLQDPNRISEFYAPLNITTNEAIEIARDSIRKLGYPLEDVLAELPPQIEMAEGIGTNVVPHVMVTWKDPRGGRAAAVEVNGNKKKIEYVRFINRDTLYRRPPETGMEPEKVMEKRGPLENADYSWQLVPYVFESIEEWNRRFEWNLPTPITTNHVSRFYLSDQGGWPHAELTFTNSWHFVFRNEGLTAADSPRRFFDSGDIPFRMKPYEGEWKLTEDKAIALARETFKKLPYPEGFIHVEQEPVIVSRPNALPGFPMIPRVKFYWTYVNPDTSEEQRAHAEVDCERGTVESISFDDSSLWGKGPPITVPISRE